MGVIVDANNVASKALLSMFDFSQRELLKAST
jgi:hypothetical protein